MKLFRADCRRGAVMVMTGLAALFLLGMVAIVTDIGYVYYQQNRLQTAVNAGWLAGFDTLVGYKSSGNLNAAAEANIKAQIKEVIMSNGFSEKELEDLEINVRPNKLEVNAKLDVGLFFARVLNVNSQEVFAARGDGRGEDNVAMAPLAIPHGVVKDLARGSYSVSFFEEESGFLKDEEYILKLGEGDKQDPGDDHLEQFEEKIYICLHDNMQNESRWAASGYANGKFGWYGGYHSPFGYEKAYGLAFWCLRIEDGLDRGFTPVEWLLDEHGGGFLMPAGKNREVVAKAIEYGFIQANREPRKGEFELITIDRVERLNQLRQRYKGKTIELYKRPRIAIYSTTETDPVMQCLNDAMIPFGTYSLPPSVGGWERDAQFDKNLCDTMHDADILENGVLDMYHWVHLHHEDFTGGGQGCKYMGDHYWKLNENNGYYYRTDIPWIAPSCYKMLVEGEIPPTLEGLERLCSYCRPFANIRYKNELEQEDWFSKYPNGKYGGKVVYMPTYHFTTFKEAKNNNKYRNKYRNYANNCLNIHRRCVDIPFTCNNNTVNSGISAKYWECEANNQTPPWYCGTDSNGAEAGCKAIWKENMLAKEKGFKDDEGAFFKRPYTGYTAFSKLKSYESHAPVNNPVPLSDKSWFGKATAGQKSKFAVVNLIRDHLIKGGFVYAQCFACETLDMALLMSDVYEQFAGPLSEVYNKSLGKDAFHIRNEQQVTNIMNAVNGETGERRAYDRCLMFKDFTYTNFPSSKDAHHYSSVPLQTSYSFSNFYTGYKKTSPIFHEFRADSYCQTHNADIISTGCGSNCGFRDFLLKDTVKTFAKRSDSTWGDLSNLSNEARYISNKIGSGTVTFFGGHPHVNTATRRLFLNNILLGSLVDKEVITAPLPPDMKVKDKVSYGPVDPSNMEGGPEKYKDRLINGFFQSITLNDYIVPELGHLINPSNDAVNARIASGTRRVIVPITAVPENIGQLHANEDTGEAAEAIYDLKNSNDTPGGIYDPEQYGFTSAVKIIGFAEFELLAPHEYTRLGDHYVSGDHGHLGHYYAGQIRGKFIRYIIKPGELEQAIEDGTLVGYDG